MSLILTVIKQKLIVLSFSFIQSISKNAHASQDKTKLLFHSEVQVCWCLCVFACLLAVDGEAAGFSNL